MKTEEGRRAALDALMARRQRYKDVKLPDNASLPAGAPMYFRCVSCGATLMEPEGYVTRSQLCAECQALKTLGWLI